MNRTEVMTLLKKNRNPRGIEHWKRLGFDRKGHKSFGIGLTQLRKLAKKVGRDHELALQLWKSKTYDARVIGLLIDEPKKITREQAEAQVEELDVAMLPHVFGSCDATLAKAPIAREVAVDWVKSKDTMRRRCGYLLLYELSKDKRDKKLDDEFFLPYIERIQKNIRKEDESARPAMMGALMGIGKRTVKLNKAAIKAAKSIGLVEFNYGDDRKCEPFDVMKHLTSDYLKKKFAT